LLISVVCALNKNKIKNRNKLISVKISNEFARRLRSFRDLPFQAKLLKPLLSVDHQVEKKTAY
jgi:hypothetical protein